MPPDKEKIPRIGLTPHPVTQRMNWGDDSEGLVFVQVPGCLGSLLGKRPIFERAATFDSQTPPPYGANLISIPKGTEITMWQRCPVGEVPETSIDHIELIDFNGIKTPIETKIPVRTVVVYVRER